MFSLKKKYTLLIVCTANRTRSVYIAEYLRHCLKTHHPTLLKRLNIRSAGTKAILGGPANGVVALIARKHGFNLRDHKASPITPRLIQQANLVLTLEQVHKEDLLKKYPEARDKIFRLMEFGEQGDVAIETLDVPDPTGKTAEDFEAFIQTAHAETDRLIYELIHQQIL